MFTESNSSYEIEIFTFWAILLIKSKKSAKKMLDINLFCKYNNKKNIFVFKSTYLASFLYVSLVGDVDSRLLEPG